MRLLRNGDFVSGAALAGLGVYIIMEARQWDYLAPDGPGPGFFPLWFGMAMVGLSVLLMGMSAVARGGGQPGKAVEWRKVGVAFAAWVGFALCVGLLSVLGFTLAYALFVFFVVATIYRRSLGAAAAVALGLTLGFYLLFPVVLGVALPVGKLGF